MILTAVVLFLALANGSNDNFKGVATLYGSGSASYRVALAWATATTLCGSLLTLVLAERMIKTFSAKGLVAEAVAQSPEFLVSAALGAAITVVIATRFGLPVSTTHALTGAFVGAGLIASEVNFAVLGKSFFLPLILSPVLSAGIVALIARFAPTRGSWVDRSHFLSAGTLSFARGLNDTPKIVAILIAARVMPAMLGLLCVGLAMAIGGMLGARRVADTMARNITTLEAGTGLLTNMTTTALVLSASIFGMPVSTTHVTTGGIFGVGLANRSAQWKTVTAILTAWVTTLPTGALCGGIAAWVFLKL